MAGKEYTKNDREFLRRWQESLSSFCREFEDSYGAANGSVSMTPAAAEERREYIHEKMIRYMESEFEAVLDFAELKRFLEDVPRMDFDETMNLSEAREWMQECYRKEIRRRLGEWEMQNRNGRNVSDREMKSKCSDHEFADHFLQIYRYDQIRDVVDRQARMYCLGGKKNRKLRKLIWGTMYGLYDDIRNFREFRRYLEYKFEAWNTEAEQDAWMREAYTDTICDCMQKFDPSIKSSFVGYTVDTFKNYRVKDALAKALKEQENAQAVDAYAEDGGSEDEEFQKTGQRGRTKRRGSAVNELEKAALEKDDELAKAIFNFYIAKIMNLFLELKDRRKNASGSKGLRDVDYFRCFFTEEIIDSVKVCDDMGVDPEELQNEDEIFLTMSESLLDYLMTMICRNFERLMHVPLKTYEEILKNGDRNRVELPLNEAVYTGYFHDVLQMDRKQDSVAVSISKYRKKYSGMIQKMKEDMR